MATSQYVLPYLVSNVSATRLGCISDCPPVIGSLFKTRWKQPQFLFSVFGFQLDTFLFFSFLHRGGPLAHLFTNNSEKKLYSFCWLLAVTYHIYIDMRLLWIVSFSPEQRSVNTKAHRLNRTRCHSQVRFFLRYFEMRTCDHGTRVLEKNNK